MAAKKSVRGKSKSSPEKRATRSRGAPAKRSRAAPARVKTKKTVKARTKAAAASQAKKPARAAAKASAAVPIAEGSRAPAFTLPGEGGKAFASAELAGKPYVLYFYPKDDTTGCTKEACDFRDAFAKFGARGVRVVGVSPDSPESHARFRGKYGLPFTLLSDPDRTLARAYGVWVKKQNYGREYMGILRSTFLVDGTGVLRRAWRGVRVPGHVDAVLAAL
jgi:thioredoxin-dependent peroxiredoxin